MSDSYQSDLDPVFDFRQISVIKNNVENLINSIKEEKQNQLHKFKKQLEDIKHEKMLKT